ncbi:MAG: hypothetical protein HC821_01585 [Lewinella sp.]|nr:hypothetical protein [Lewinella sp.]
MIDNVEDPSPISTPAAKPLVEEVRSFYQQDFLALIKTFFTNPITGLSTIFQFPPEKAFLHSIIIFVSVFLVYLTSSYLMAGDFREYMEFSAFLKISVVPVLFLLLLSALAYGIKMLFVGQAFFRNELLTGALCGIPLLVLVIVAILFTLFGNANGLAVLNDPLGSSGLVLLALVYILFLLANTFQQSLRAAGVGEVIAWYLAPSSILLAMFVSAKVAGAIF